MEKIKDFLDSCNIEYGIIEDGSAEFTCTNDDFNLFCSYVDNNLTIKLTGCLNNDIYSYFGVIEDEDEVISKLQEAINMYNTASLVYSDLNRKDDNKEILLDDKDLNVISTEEVAINDVKTTDAIESLYTIKDSLLNIANNNSDLVDKFNQDETELRSIALGLISTIYTCAQEFDEFINFISSDTSVNESIAIAPKVYYIDLAKGGLSQACMALKNCAGYEPLIGVLKDINSELKTK